jgi:hypothetical protein
MPPEKREKLVEWTCRILMTIDFFVIIAGYLSYLQLKRQLNSPLIPKSTLFQILSDTGIMEPSIISAIPFLIGLWFYSFNLKIPAIVLFGLTIVVYKVLLVFF